MCAGTSLHWVLCIYLLSCVSVLFCIASSLKYSIHMSVSIICVLVLHCMEYCVFISFILCPFCVTPSLKCSVRMSLSISQKLYMCTGTSLHWVLRVHLSFILCLLQCRSIFEMLDIPVIEYYMCAGTSLHWVLCLSPLSSVSVLFCVAPSLNARYTCHWVLHVCWYYIALSIVSISFILCPSLAFYVFTH